jgi:hypothetical protein
MKWRQRKENLKKVEIQGRRRVTIKVKKVEGKIMMEIEA